MKSNSFHFDSSLSAFQLWVKFCPFQHFNTTWKNEELKHQVKNHTEIICQWWVDSDFCHSAYDIIWYRVITFHLIHVLNCVFGGFFSCLFSLDDLEQVMKSYGFSTTVVLSRRSGPEFLSVLKFVCLGGSNAEPDGWEDRKWLHENRASHVSIGMKLP